MNFARPEFLWLLLIVPPLAVWAARGRRRRARGWAGLARGGRPLGDGAAGWLGAMACLALALAQPRWGHVPEPPLPPGQDVVLLVDTSRSMAAEDAVPDRLGVAVEAAESLLAALGREAGNRTAVVAFAGRGRVRCPLTENLGAAAEALRALRPGDVRPGGTDLGAALDTALDACDDQERAGGRTVVLFSDGEDLAGRWAPAVDRLRAARVIVHAVAVGDPDRGHPVPSGRGAEPLTYHGAPVLSRRTDLPLEALAGATGGAVVKLGLAPADLGALYLARIAPVARQRRETFRLTERAERFSVFVLAALALGLGGSWPGRLPRLGAPWLLLAVALGAPGAGSARPTAGDLVARGRAAYAAGRYAEALALFDRALALDPAQPIVRFDVAAMLFQLDRFEEASAQYQAARDRAGPALRTKIDYALGNTALALGDVGGAIRHYRDCLASGAPGAALDAVRRDAAINLRFAEEQARRPAPPPEASEKPDSPRQQPRPDRDQTGGGEPPSPSAAPPAPGGAAPPGGAPQGQPPQARRGPGGAGGSGSPPPRPGAPEDRLNEALEHIREAQRRRLPDAPPPAADDDRKDW